MRVGLVDSNHYLRSHDRCSRPFQKSRQVEVHVPAVGMWGRSVELSAVVGSIL